MLTDQSTMDPLDELHEKIKARVRKQNRLRKADDVTPKVFATAAKGAGGLVSLQEKLHATLAEETTKDCGQAGPLLRELSKRSLAGLIDRQEVPADLLPVLAQTIRDPRAVFEPYLSKHTGWEVVDATSGSRKVDCDDLSDTRKTTDPIYALNAELTAALTQALAADGKQRSRFNPTALLGTIQRLLPKLVFVSKRLKAHNYGVWSKHDSLVKTPWAVA